MFGKSGQKYQNIQAKAEFQKPKHPYKTTVETFKYLHKKHGLKLLVLGENWLSKKQPKWGNFAQSGHSDGYFV